MASDEKHAACHWVGRGSRNPRGVPHVLTNSRSLTEVAGPPPPASPLSPQSPGYPGDLLSSVLAVRGQALALFSSAALLSSAKLGHLSLEAVSGKGWLCAQGRKEISLG